VVRASPTPKNEAIALIFNYSSLKAASVEAVMPKILKNKKNPKTHKSTQKAYKKG